VRRNVRKRPARRQLRTPQQARSRRTREHVLKAAVTCFEKRGYDETTTAHIARTAGIGVGTLYGYFKDKRAILLELLDGTVNEIANSVIRSLEPGLWLKADPRGSVRRLIQALFHTQTINPGMQRILWERYFKDPEFRTAVEAIEDRIRAALMNLFTTLHAAGRLRIDDLHTAAFVIHLSIQWTASRLLLGSTPVDASRAADAASDMISRFVFTDE
jgi:AcrR family transcriptional regulator